MDKNEIEEGLEEIAKIANSDGVCIELAIYGGSALALKWEFRKATRDVDIIVSGDATYIRNAAKKVAEKKGWPTDWMNDAVKGFASPRGDHELYKEYMHDNGGIMVFIPSARYLLAMKCMAMRIDEPDGHNDIDDILALIEEVGIKDESDLFQLVEAYYPQQKITPKISFGIQEIMNKINSDITRSEGRGEGAWSGPQIRQQSASRHPIMATDGEDRRNQMMSDAHIFTDILSMCEEMDRLSSRMAAFNLHREIQKALQDARTYDIPQQAAIHQALDHNIKLRSAFLDIQAQMEGLQPRIEAAIKMAASVNNHQNLSSAEAALTQGLEKLRAHIANWPAREKVQNNLEAKEPTPPDTTIDTGTMKTAKPKSRKKL
jgi:hypothetical protein